MMETNRDASRFSTRSRLKYESVWVPNPMVKDDSKTCQEDWSSEKSVARIPLKSSVARNAKDPVE
ncbi:MAG: hypothetical protein HZB91_07820 [Elusimicrobia bacterium]|nr:hypothetical protein [Elusimicrobiota bacterium]